MKEFKGFRRGVNLGGWMSQCDYSKDRLDNFITEPDFAKIASWGLDHVRLPFDYNIVETENGDAYIEDGFRRIGEAIRLSRKYGLNIILDLHKTCGFSFDKGETQFGLFDDPALQERFCRLWEQMARRFGNDPEHVAFELLNEVTEQEYSKKWNELAKKCIGRIRAFAPDTVILVGSYWNNHATAVKDMDPPYDDKIVYNFHSYDPLPFTHQGAHWVDSLDINARVPFEESGATEAFFEDLFAEAVKIAEERGTVLYCGEYGVIDVAEPGDVLKWYGTIN
ncbi:MAG: cellulase family glycosylhydrolase, partial [Clostridia bacterium]|nr:cellulase family glycosylhydrolase [Clostridia bacterium]